MGLDKIYASASAMNSDNAPVSDLTGKPLKGGQLAVIVAGSASEDNGKVYRFDNPGWTYVSTIGNLNIVQETGNSETAVMSQKAVTNLIEELKNAGYVFAGIATPETNPGTPDQNVFYLAWERGVYANFNNINVTQPALLLNDSGEWYQKFINLAPRPYGKSAMEPIDELLEDLTVVDMTGKTMNELINSNGGITSGMTKFYISPYIDVSATQFQYYLLNIQGIAPSFAQWVTYDEDKNILDIIVADLRYSNGNYRLNIAADVKYIRINGYSDTNYLFTAPRRKDMSSLLNKLVTPYFVQQPLIVESALVPVEVTWVSGIFGAANEGFWTSGYIDLTDESIFRKGSYVVWKLVDDYASSYHKIEFYDANNNVVAYIPGGVGKKGVIYILKIPVGAVKMKYSSYKKAYEIFTMPHQNAESSLSQLTDVRYTKTNNIVWVGTSIPEGAQYPAKAGAACGYNTINWSYGSSQLRFTNEHPETVEYYSGRCLTATVAELEALYRNDVTAGTITETTLEAWKDHSYERCIIPYIDGTNAQQASAIVIDHGFNDRINIHTLMQNTGSIDWDSRDRSNFVGAFNYLLDKIFEKKPTMKIIIAGYFQNTVELADYYSAEICQMQEMIAEHFSIQLMAAWKYTQINDKFVAGTSNYLDNFNQEYDTSYQKWTQDDDGNIISMQLYCPDRVHPHSDLTGNCDARLNAVYTKLLKNSL